MRTVLSKKYISGTFIKELKNRFLCEVSINGKDTVCYVPSSCHLSNFLKLKGKEVFLTPIRTPNSRTEYALFAVPFKHNYIILNTSMANRALENSLQSKRFSYLGKRKTILKEYGVESYKADIFLPESNTIIEIKSIISLKNSAEFPTVYSERTLKQLKRMNSLLRQGYRVFFIIVSLHPYIKEIKLDKNTPFFVELQECINNGLIVKAYSCRLKQDNAIIDKEIFVKC